MMRNPDWEKDGVQLYLGDCLEILPQLETGSVDAILTDIPYGTTQCSWDEIIPFEPMWREVKRLLKPRGVFVTTASQPFTSKLVMSNLDWFKCEWIWDKVNGSNMANVNLYPFKIHENIMVFSSNGGFTYNPILTKASIPFGKTRDHKSDVTADVTGKVNHGIGYPKSIIRRMRPNNLSDDGYLHPTQKPVDLYAYLTRTYSNDGDTILDFTMGSGTTGVACMQTGRKFIGIEIEPKYFEIAVKRISQAQLQIRMDL